MKRLTVVLGILAAAVALVLLWGITAYNRLVSLDQGVSAQWAQVENVYQRRADLVPNLVATVKGAAAFEHDTLVEVTEARSRVGALTVDERVVNDPEELRRFQQAQDQLSSALTHLLAVSEAYPELTATANFRDLQAQLEGSENRIAVERQRYNDAARAFNTARDTLPTAAVAGLVGSRFAEKAYFAAQTGAETAPRVQF